MPSPGQDQAVARGAAAARAVSPAQQPEQQSEDADAAAEDPRERTVRLLEGARPRAAAPGRPLAPAPLRQARHRAAAAAGSGRRRQRPPRPGPGCRSRSEGRRPGPGRGHRPVPGGRADRPGARASTTSGSSTSPPPLPPRPSPCANRGGGTHLPSWPISSAPRRPMLSSRRAITVSSMAVSRWGNYSTTASEFPITSLSSTLGEMNHTMRQHMTFSVTEMKRSGANALSAQRQHVPLSALNPREAAARSAGRAIDVPGRSTKIITFNSSL